MRIIPARAGFTVFVSSRVAFSWDHPRSRGVYRLSVSVMPEMAGSSPLARGLRIGGGRRGRRRGIIPARAGFTLIYVGNGDSLEDHPRSRGGYSVAL